MNDLKNYDDKLIYIIIFNVAVTLLLNNPATFIENNELISFVLTVPVLYLPIYIINNLLSREWKYKILYPKNDLHRFAYGIFTRLRNNEIKYDSKLIDVELILDNHEEPKTEPEEDDLWYKIYNEYRYDNKIYQQNRQFLFCRDSMAAVLIITLIFLVVGLFVGFNSIILTMVCLGTFEFCFFREYAIKHNKILVLSVLQEETAHLRKKDKCSEILNISNYNLINT